MHPALSHLMLIMVAEVVSGVSYMHLLNCFLVNWLLTAYAMTH